MDSPIFIKLACLGSVDAIAHLAAPPRQRYSHTTSCWCSAGVAFNHVHVAVQNANPTLLQWTFLTVSLCFKVALFSFTANVGFCFQLVSPLNPPFSQISGLSAWSLDMAFVCFKTKLDVTKCYSSGSSPAKAPSNRLYSVTCGLAVMPLQAWQKAIQIY